MDDVKDWKESTLPQRARYTCINHLQEKKERKKSSSALHAAVVKMANEQRRKTKEGSNSALHATVAKMKKEKKKKRRISFTFVVAAIYCLKCQHILYLKILLTFHLLQVVRPLGLDYFFEALQQQDWEVKTLLNVSLICRSVQPLAFIFNNAVVKVQKWMLRVRAVIWCKVLCEVKNCRGYNASHTQPLFWCKMGSLVALYLIGNVFYLHESKNQAGIKWAL